VLACAGILIAGVAAWSNSFNGPLIFDDLTAIRDNPALRHFPSWRNFVPPKAGPISRRPIVNLTLAINYAIGGLGVRGYHAGNLLIHLLAALALFGVIRRTLLAPPLEERFGHAASALAFASALIWAVHPLQTESVTYLTQRTESLMGLFFLLTLYGTIRGASSRHPWRWYAAAIAACALGMGSKEVMATAPIVVLLYDRCFLAGSFREALRRRLSFYLGLAATWAILAALLIAYPWGGATAAGFGLGEVGPWEYARTQPGVILNYLKLSFWPGSLCLDYGWPIATGARQIVPAGALLAALLAWTVWALCRAPALGFLGAWFFLILAPSSSFVPIAKEIAAERRMYLPLAAIVTGCVAAVWRIGGQFIRRAAESAGTRKLLASVLAAVALLVVATELGYQTFERNAAYRSAISIWQDTADKRPSNSGAQNNLGTAYLQAGRPDEAISCFSKAIELKPAFFEPYNNRAAAYTVTGRLDEAIADFDRALTLQPDSAAAYSGRAAAYLHLQRYDSAVSDCTKAISLQPDLASAYNTRGVAYARASRLAEAIRDYSTAIRLDPDYAEAYSNRGAAEASANRPAEAIQDCSRAIQLQPGYVEAFENRSNAYLRAGQYALAIADCDKAIELSPDRSRAYINRAAACSQIGQYEQALADVQRFRELGGQPPQDFVEALLRAAGRSK
jgi:tetratricopeptide (TPR) repeat protein